MLHARTNARAHTRGAVDLVGDIIGEQCIVADQRVEYGAELAAIELLRRCPHLRVFENGQLVLTPVPPRLLGPVAFYPLSRTFFLRHVGDRLVIRPFGLQLHKESFV